MEGGRWRVEGGQQLEMNRISGEKRSMEGIVPRHHTYQFQIWILGRKVFAVPAQQINERAGAPGLCNDRAVIAAARCTQLV